MSARTYEIAFRLGASMNSSMRTAFANANRNLSDTARNAERANRQTGILGKGMGSLKGVALGLGGALAGAFAVSSIIGFGKKMAETSAELQAVREQYEQVMGAMTVSTDKYLGQMGQKWNKHPGELESTMMQYYAILKGKGIEEGKAYELAQNYLERSVDANMFANESMADTTARFMGMIKGEYTSVDTAMVNMNVTLLNTKALETYKKKWEKLTITEQETLKTQEALRQHTAAGVFGQGEREADSYANNLAMVKNTWDALLAKFGSPILGIVNKQLIRVTSVLNKINPDQVMKKFENFKNTMSGFSSAISKKINFGELIKKFQVLKNSVTTEFSSLVAKVKPIAMTVINVWSNVFQQISTFWDKHGSKIISALGVAFQYIKTVVNGLISVVQTILPIIAPFVNKIVGFVLSIVEQIATFWNENGKQIIQAVQNVFTVINKVIQFLAPVVLLILNSVWANVKGVIQGALKVILGVVKIFATLFTGDWSGLWKAVKQVLVGAVQFLWNLWNLMMVGKLVKSVGTIVKGIVGFFKGLGTKLATNVQYYYHLFMDGFYKIGIGIFKSIAKSVGSIVGVAGSAISRFITIFQTARTFGVNIFMSIVSAVRGMFSSVIGFIENSISTVVGAVVSRVSGFIGAIRAIIGNLWTNVSSIFMQMQMGMISPFTALKGVVSSVVGAITGLVKGLFTGVTGAGRGAINSLVVAANAMIGGINKVSLTVPDWVPEFGGSTIGFNLPTIPMLANGGITQGATLAMIGEGKEQEAVLPLSKLDALLGKSNNNSSGGSGQQIVYNPSYVFYGNPSKNDVEQVQQKGFQEFKRFAKDLDADRKRLSFNQ
ncbi:hypothetical protein [Psychrobacillus sp.]|uniref:phage tail protein n=1 Tax=Psychrobacillus sp. TaxID=1871623 RepID=UPI0028BD1F9C|nr:hypothetical protein [Psychrobacillus sp.]